MTDDNDTTERAKELLVYGPLGLALFLRDSAPQFMRMFVARGRTEFAQRRRSVGEQIEHVRSFGETATVDGGPEVLRFLSTGINTLREKAEAALGALGVSTSESPSSRATAAAPGPSARTAPAGVPVSRPDLAIPGYDDLSASQVVDHLDGLSQADLEAIRAYEASSRARNTILGKIEQLTRGS